MGLRAAFEAAQPFVIGLGLPIAIGISGVLLPIQINQAETIGALDERTSNILQRLDGIDRSISNVEISNSRIEDNIAADDIDPVKWIAAAGLYPVELFIAARVGDDVFVFPKDNKSFSQVQNSGMPQEVVMPGVTAFKLGEIGPNGSILWDANILPKP